MILTNNTEFAFSGKRNDFHVSHCFEYLRNYIMCSGDMTLEPQMSPLDKPIYEDGHGRRSAHVCRNMDEAMEWIEARRPDDIRDISGGVAT